MFIENTIIKFCQKVFGHTVANRFWIEQVILPLLLEEIGKVMPLGFVVEPGTRWTDTLRAFQFALMKRTDGMENRLHLRMKRFWPIEWHRVLNFVELNCSWCWPRARCVCWADVQFFGDAERRRSVLNPENLILLRSENRPWRDWNEIRPYPIILKRFPVQTFFARTGLVSFIQNKQALD